ncbi:Uncharacterised protein [Candidatus Burarchaeum australiense]|nr:Uncharacterised protein [Candidatus Burarchaeum australiense]
MKKLLIVGLMIVALVLIFAGYQFYKIKEKADFKVGYFGPYVLKDTNNLMTLLYLGTFMGDGDPNTGIAVETPAGTSYYRKAYYGRAGAAPDDCAIREAPSWSLEFVDDGGTAEAWRSWKFMGALYPFIDKAYFSKKFHQNVNDMLENSTYLEKNPGIASFFGNRTPSEAELWAAYTDVWTSEMNWSATMNNRILGVPLDPHIEEVAYYGSDDALIIMPNSLTSREYMNAKGYVDGQEINLKKEEPVLIGILTGKLEAGEHEVKLVLGDKTIAKNFSVAWIRLEGYRIYDDGVVELKLMNLMPRNLTLKSVSISLEGTNFSSTVNLNEQLGGFGTELESWQDAEGTEFWSLKTHKIFLHGTPLQAWTSPVSDIRMTYEDNGREITETVRFCWDTTVLPANERN